MVDNHDEQYQQGDLKAIITVDGKEYKTVSLTKEEQIIDIQTKFGHIPARVMVKVFNPNRSVNDPDELDAII